MVPPPCQAAPRGIHSAMVRSSPVATRRPALLILRPALGRAPDAPCCLPENPTVTAHQ
jgi:hypothetical protein